jgi:hypothetical protein
MADYRVDALAAWAQRAGLHGVCVEHFLLSPALVAPLLAGGLSVTTGTINHAALLEPLLDLGLDAVTSDCPHELWAELGSRRDTSPLAA